MLALDNLGIDFIFNGFSELGKVNKVENGIKSFIGTVGKAAGVASSLYAIGGAVKDMVLRGSDIADVSRRTGESIDGLDKWGRALKVFGGDANTFNQTVRSMSKSIMDASLEGGEFGSWMQSLGVPLADGNKKIRQVSDILLDLADNWQQFDERTRSHIADKLGLPEAVVKALWQGGDAMRGLVKEMGELYTMSEQDSQNASQALMLWNLLKAAWSSAKDELASKLLPAIIWVLDKLNALSITVIKNKEVLYAAASAFSSLITAKLIPALVIAGKALLGFLAPALPLALAFTAIGMAVRYLIKDFQKWRETGESAFGSLWKNAEDAYFFISSAFGKLGKILAGIWNDPKKAWNDAVGFFKAGFTKFEKWFLGLNLFAAGENLIDTIYLGIKAGVSWLWDKAGGLLGSDSSARGFFNGLIRIGKKSLSFILGLGWGLAKAAARIPLDIISAIVGGEDIAEKLFAFFSYVWESPKKAWSDAVQWMTGKYNDFINWLLGQDARSAEAASKNVNAIVLELDKFNPIVQFKKAMEDVYNYLFSFIKRGADIGKKIGEAIADAISAAIPDIEDYWDRAWAAVGLADKNQLARIEKKKAKREGQDLKEFNGIPIISAEPKSRLEFDPMTGRSKTPSSKPVDYSQYRPEPENKDRRHIQSAIDIADSIDPNKEKLSLGELIALSLAANNRSGAFDLPKQQTHFSDAGRNSMVNNDNSREINQTVMITGGISVTADTNNPQAIASAVRNGIEQATPKSSSTDNALSK